MRTRHSDESSAGIRYAAAYAGIRKVEKDDVALIVSRYARIGRGGVHEESRGGGTGDRSAAQSSRIARAHAGRAG